MTGGIAPQDRTPLPPSRVEVPDGLLNLPGGYFGDSASVTDLVAVVEHGHAPDGVTRALDVLGISPVVVRRDLSNAQAVKPVAATDDLVDRLERSGLFEPLVDHGVAVLFRVRDVQAGPSTHHPVAGPADAEGGVTAAVIAIDDTDPELTVEHQSTEIRLSAEDQTACIDAPLPLAVPSVLELEIDVRSGRGATACGPKWLSDASTASGSPPIPSRPPSPCPSTRPTRPGSSSTPEPTASRPRSPTGTSGCVT
jgi:hypothetical protein